MTVGDWLGVCTLILSMHGFVYMILNKRIDNAEDHTREVVGDMWARAKETFATKEDSARMEGKLDAILINLEYFKEKVNEHFR